MNTSDTITLPGYQIQLYEDGPLHSRTKLDSAATDFARDCQVDPSVIHSKPCASMQETVQYRCTCAFQMVLDEEQNYHYAMRTHGQAVKIGTNAFPIATLCIQNVMKLMIYHLNNYGDEYNLVREYLSSVSFVSSWEEEGKDCIVTLNYAQQINPDDASFLEQLEQLRLQCEMITLIARSKKKKLEIGRVSPYMEDDIVLTRLHHGGFQVSLNKKVEKVHPDDNQTLVSYRKPEDAFQHPNGNTMIQALEWMLNRLHLIQNDLQEVPIGNRYLLEMYCGCGAHTMAIAKAKLFDYIVAVEIDQRLVDACLDNCERNGCRSSSEVLNDSNMNTINSTPVQVFQGDAGDFAAKALRKKDNVRQTTSVYSKSYWQSQSFQVLLVDPPRGGLDEHVLNLAMNSPFQHLIYISCGKNALIRDLKVLSTAFEVADCTLTDLFPRTDSVETLLHLKRKQTI
jgi:tRNA/tmRNA/rRNA uracil-C5-methylase (TrmA/RlmC/RlmD family)